MTLLADLNGVQVAHCHSLKPSYIVIQTRWCCGISSEPPGLRQRDAEFDGVPKGFAALSL